MLFWSIVITIIFMVLKLNGTVDWSWLGVLFPVIIVFTLDVVLTVLYLMGVK